MYDESMSNVFVLYFTFISIFHTEQKNIKYKILNISTQNIIENSWHFLDSTTNSSISWQFPDFLAKFIKFLTIPDKVATLIQKELLM